MADGEVYWPGAGRQIDCIIPARGGSKRFPRKNLAKLSGHPLVGLAIESARLSRVFGGVYVSTEDSEIAATSREYGAAVIDRPPELAQDHIQVKEVVRHALGVLGADRERLGLSPRPFVGVVYPTAFLLTPQDIAAMSMLLTVGSIGGRRVDGVMSVVTPSEHPLGAMAREGNGFISPWIAGESEIRKRSQEWPDLVMDAGCVYLYRVEKFLEWDFYPPNLLGYEMPRTRVFDIDYPQDLEVAEALLDFWVKKSAQKV